jgi:insulysin
MITAPAFDQLRTQEQLGYVVHSGAIEAATNMSYRILIQGEKAPIYLGGRIDAFLTKFAGILGEMPDSEFELHKSSLVRERLEKLKPKNVKEAASRVWSSIRAGHFDFMLGMTSLSFINPTDIFEEQHDAEAVENLTKDDMVIFYKDKILPSSAIRSKLAVHFEVQTPTETHMEGTIGDEWMRSLDLEGTKVGDGDESEVGTRRAASFTDVAEFKSMMKVIEAPQPVEDIEQFEDLDAKVE